MKMKSWNLIYYNQGNSSVKKWLDSLTDEQLKSVAKELLLLEKCGNTLRLPHSKSLGKGLFELRERNFGYRIYYSFLPDFTIFLLHAGGKTSQNKDINIARERLDAIRSTVNENSKL